MQHSTPDPRSFRVCGSRRVMWRLRAWHWTVLGFTLVFTAACAGTVPSALEPVATVAAAGVDASDFDATSGSSEEVAAADFDPLAFDVVELAERDEVRVEAPGAETVVVRITSVTIGEALAFLSGGHMPSTRGTTFIVEHGDVLSLDALLEQGAGLLTIDARALDSDEDVVGMMRKLVQVVPFGVSAHRQGGTIEVAVTSDDDVPVQSAHVELLDADSRVLDTSDTDARGKTSLEVKVIRPIAVLGDGLFVTARIGQFTALLAL